jgi:catechol 2,3-dioxygenase-like lactoylglutathione lyase family enzyme
MIATDASLKITHFHVKVRDLDAALEWFESKCGARPTFKKEGLAYLTMGAVVLVLESGLSDTPVTIAFGSTDCDRDFAALVARGATPIAEPKSQPWGIRGAYFTGPGAITFELEQSIERASA